MQSWDGFLHVRPLSGATYDAKKNDDALVVGIAAIFNPTDKTIKESVTLPLYYTGLTYVNVILALQSTLYRDCEAYILTIHIKDSRDEAMLSVGGRDGESSPTSYRLDRDYSVSIPLTLANKSIAYVIIRRQDGGKVEAIDIQ